MSGGEDRVRPKVVPEGAWWEEARACWLFGENDAEGLRHGAFIEWLDDGTMSALIYYDHGEIIERHSYDVGQAEMGSAGGGAAAELARADRPDCVASSAHFNAERQQWEAGPLDRAGRASGYWRFWRVTGELVEEAEFDHGLRHGRSRLFKDDGRLRAEGRYSEGRRAGTWRAYHDGMQLAEEASYAFDLFDGLVRRYDVHGRVLEELSYARGELEGPYQAPIAPGSYADARIHSERGLYLAGRRHGVWLLVDEAGQCVQRLDFGLPRVGGREAGSPVWWNGTSEAQHWRDLMVQCVSERRVAEALLLGARAAAAAGDPGELTSLLWQHAARRPQQVAHELAVKLIGEAGDDPERLIDALLWGASPAEILLALAEALAKCHAPHAAYDFATAALLMAPFRHEFYYTRGMVNAARGWERAARLDARRLAACDEALGEHLTTYLDLVFPSFGFWPGEEPLDGHRDAVEPFRVKRSLSEVHALARQYVAGLTRLRARIMSLAPVDAEWLPPDYAGVFDYAPKDPQAEPVPPAADAHDLLGLMQQLLADHAALTWLCWSVGETQMRLPERVEAPRLFTNAAQQSFARLSYLRTRLGDENVSRLAQEPVAYDWRGRCVASLPGQHVFVLEKIQAAMAATFAWLCDEKLSSPRDDKASNLLYLEALLGTNGEANQQTQVASLEFGSKAA